MINEQRVRLMTRMAAFESENEAELYRVRNSFRSDYIGSHLIKNAIRVTLAFFIGLLAWGCYNMDRLVKEITTMDIGAFVLRIVIVYLIVLVAYMVITYAVFAFQYLKAKEDLEEYQKLLNKLAREYELEDAKMNGSVKTGGDRHGDIT